METIQHANCTIRIEQDDDPQNPRVDYDNVGIMCCWHNRHTLGDEDFISKLSDALEPYGIEGIEHYEPHVLQGVVEAAGFHILPLYLYDHSGITMNTTGFHCPWDSGRVGFICMSPDTAKDECIKDPLACLRGEVETYDQYLRGDVWGYIVTHDETGEEDSCWGFFGSDDCEEEAKSVAESMEREYRLDRQARVAELIRNRVPLEVRARELGGAA